MPPLHPSVTGTQWHTLTTWDIRGPRTLKEQDAFRRLSVLGCPAKRSGWLDSKHSIVEQLHTKRLEGNHSVKQDMNHHVHHMACYRTAEYWMRGGRVSGCDRPAHRAIHSFTQKKKTLTQLLQNIHKIYFIFFFKQNSQSAVKMLLVSVTQLRMLLEYHICLKAILISDLLKPKSMQVH